MAIIRDLQKNYTFMDTSLERLRDIVEKADYEDILLRKKAYRRDIYMVRVKDSEDKRLPLFMIKLKNGNIATCYEPSVINEEIVSIFAERNI